MIENAQFFLIYYAKIDFRDIKKEQMQCKQMLMMLQHMLLMLYYFDFFNKLNMVCVVYFIIYLVTSDVIDLFKVNSSGTIKWFSVHLQMYKVTVVEREILCH